MPYGLSPRYGGYNRPKKSRPGIKIPQTTEADTAAGVTPKTVKRIATPPRPTAPTPKPAQSTDDTDMPRADLSSALIKGAALVPQFSGSNTVRGLLSGASVGMDIGDSLAKYRKKKEKASLARDALNLGTGRELGPGATQ